MTQVTTWQAFPVSTFKPERIQLSAVFGSPERSCAGSGLCRLLPRSALRHWSANCPIWAATMTWSAQGYFQLTVETEYAERDQICRDFTSRTIYLESPFVFPPWLCKRLHIREAVVESGHYPLDARRGKWIMLFKVTRQQSTWPF